MESFLKRQSKYLFACLASCFIWSGAPTSGEASELHFAAKIGDIGSINRIQADGADPNSRDDRGITPLCWAAAAGQKEAVLLLLRMGAEKDGRNEDGVTPLIAAAFFGRADSARELLNNGADAQAQNRDGAKALDVLQASWNDTLQLANTLQIEVDRAQVEAGRNAVGELLRQDSTDGSGHTLFVLSIVFGSITAVLALIAGILWLVHVHEKKRTEALKTTATEIGLSFSDSCDDQFLARMQVFSLFKKGHGRKVKNVFSAETEAAKLRIFDYQFTTRAGQNSQTHHQTVFAIDSGSLGIPYFSLRPEGFLDRIGSVVGLQDIDFDSHPEFSESYVLKGNDEEAIRSFFDVELLNLLMLRKDISAEGVPGLFIYLQGGRKKPEEIQQLMSDGYDLYSAFSERLSRMKAN